MLIPWWLHLLDRLGHYVIRPRAIAQILMITNNVMTLGYIYAKCSLNTPLKIFCQIEHISQLISWISSRLSWTPELQGRDLSQLYHSLIKAFTVTNNHDVQTTLYTSTWYMFWDSGCTHYINPYFDLYIDYKPLEKGNNTEVNDIGGSSSPWG